MLNIVPFKGFILHFFALLLNFVLLFCFMNKNHDVTANVRKFVCFLILSNLGIHQVGAKVS